MYAPVYKYINKHVIVFSYVIVLYCTILWSTTCLFYCIAGYGRPSKLIALYWIRYKKTNTEAAVLAGLYHLSLSIDDNVALGDVSSASFISYHREGPEWDQQHRQCNRLVWSQCDGQLSRSDLCWMQLHLIACKGHRAVGTAHPGGCYDECVFVSAWRSKHGHIVCPVVTSWTAHKGHSRSSVSNLSHPYQTELEIAATSTRPKKQLNGARVANWRFHHHPHATRIKPLSYNY